MHRVTASRTKRRLARAQQTLLEQERLLRHQEIARLLVSLPATARRKLIAHAIESVARWRERALCSADYIERWELLLQLPVQELAWAITSDMDGWGTAMRQNSPWNGQVPGLHSRP